MATKNTKNKARREPKVRCSAVVSRTTKPTRSEMAKALSDARKAVSKLSASARYELLQKGMAIIYSKRSPAKCG